MNQFSSSHFLVRFVKRLRTYYTSDKLFFFLILKNTLCEAIFKERNSKPRCTGKFNNAKIQCLILIVCCINPCISQNARLIISQYTTDHGLPQNSVKFIAFDKWGFCWISTE